MNDIAEQRPSFFEGEILSASDLEQVVVYMRDQSARHMLGGHTWGIAAGLQLLEQTAPSGSIDVYLLPGYAVDGYGRGIVVVNPLRLSVDSFNGQPTGPVQVWIRYDQGDTSATQPGFQVCCPGGDTYSRVAESYAIEVGNLSFPTQQSGISIGGEAVDDARTAPRTFNDDGPVVCDASVPYQDLPLADDTKSQWLIPLGEVGWQAGTPGQFVTLVDPTDPSKVIYSRRLRHYVGVVAENVYAADGLIRLRRRTHEVAGTVTQQVVDTACSGGDLTDTKYDAALENCTEGPTPTELVWVEGRMRVTHDVRILAPGRLELRDKHSTDYYPATAKGSMPTFLERQDIINGTNNRADLAIVLGQSAAQTPPNRLLIQQASAPQQPLPCHDVAFTQTTMMAITDSGNVGIGTDSPDEALEIVGKDAPVWIHLQDQNAPSDMYLGAAEKGGVLATGPNNNDLRIRTNCTDPDEDDNTRMIVLSTGQVGIGTGIGSTQTPPDPNRAVTIQATGQASLITRTQDLKHEGLLRTDSNGTLLGAHTSGDDLILSSDGDETGKVWLKPTGYVGINTSSPAHRVGIVDPTEAKVATRTSGGIEMVLGASASAGGVVIGSTTDHDLSVTTSGTTQVTVTKTDGRVGIGTSSPKTQLDVRGEITLGTTGQYNAPGGYQPWAVIAGSIPVGVPQSGPGWQAAWTAVPPFLGTFCQVAFTPGGFSASAVPVVTVTLVSATFNVFSTVTPIVSNISNTGFTVALWDGDQSAYAFNFIALVPR